MYCIKYKGKMLQINTVFDFNTEDYFRHIYPLMHQTAKTYICSKFQTKEEAEHILKQLLSFNKKAYEYYIDIMKNVKASSNLVQYMSSKNLIRRYDTVETNTVIEFNKIFKGYTNVTYGNMEHIINKCSKHLQEFEKTINEKDYKIAEITKGFIEFKKSSKLKTQFRKNNVNDNVNSLRDLTGCSRCGMVLSNVEYLFFKNVNKEFALCPMCLKSLTENVDSIISSIPQDVMNEYYSKVINHSLD